MQALVMGMNHGMDNEDNIAKKKSSLMDYLMGHIRVIADIYESRVNLIEKTAFRFGK